MFGRRKKKLRAAFFHAVQFGENDSLVKLLADHPEYDVEYVYIDKKLPKALHGCRLVHIAAACGQLEIMKTLVEPKGENSQGALIDVPTKSGYMPLHVAAANGALDTIPFLLEKGSPVDERDQNGHTPLHVASLNGHKALVGLLINQGATVNAFSLYGDRPLHLTVANGFRDISQVLIAYGANGCLTNQAGRTPLDVFRIARKKGYYDIDQTENNQESSEETEDAKAVGEPKINDIQLSIINPVHVMILKLFNDTTFYVPRFDQMLLDALGEEIVEMKRPLPGKGLARHCTQLSLSVQNEEDIRKIEREPLFEISFDNPLGDSFPFSMVPLMTKRDGEARLYADYARSHVSMSSFRDYSRDLELMMLLGSQSASEKNIAQVSYFMYIIQEAQAYIKYMCDVVLEQMQECFERDSFLAEMFWRSVDHIKVPFHGLDVVTSEKYDSYFKSEESAGEKDPNAPKAVNKSTEALDLADSGRKKDEKADPTVPDAPDWREYIDEKAGKSYFHSKSLGKTTWKVPAVYRPARVRHNTMSPGSANETIVKAEQKKTAEVESEKISEKKEKEKGKQKEKLKEKVEEKTEIQLESTEDLLDPRRIDLKQSRRFMERVSTTSPTLQRKNMKGKELNRIETVVSTDSSTKIDVIKGVFGKKSTRSSNNALVKSRRVQDSKPDRYSFPSKLKSDKLAIENPLVKKWKNVAKIALNAESQPRTISFARFFRKDSPKLTQAEKDEMKMLIRSYPYNFAKERLKFPLENLVPLSKSSERKLKELPVSELLTSEHVYIVMLEYLIKGFLLPMREAALLAELSKSEKKRNSYFISSTDVAALFRNIEDIYTYHLKWFKLIRVEYGLPEVNISEVDFGKSKKKSWNEISVVRVFTVIPNLLDMLRTLYSYFNSRQSQAQGILLKLLRSEAFLKFAEERKLILNLDLSSYLITPVQRLPRYELLIRDILKQETKSKTKKQLEDILSQIQECTLFVNGKIKEQEARVRMLQIIEELQFDDPIDMDIFSKKERIYIDEYDILMYPDIINSPGKTKKRYLFVLNNALIIAKKKKKGYHYKGIVPLSGRPKISKGLVNTGKKVIEYVEISIKESSHVMVPEKTFDPDKIVEEFQELVEVAIEEEKKWIKEKEKQKLTLDKQALELMKKEREKIHTKVTEDEF